MSIVSGSLFEKRCIVKENGARSRRVYIDDPSEAPSDSEVQEGARGGLYYEMPLSLEEMVPEGKELDTWDSDLEPAFEMGVLQGQGFVADVEGVGRDVFDVVSIEGKYSFDPAQVVLEDKDGNQVDGTFSPDQIDVSHRLIDVLDEFGRPVNVPDIDVPEVDGVLSDEEIRQIVDDIDTSLVDADSREDVTEQQDQLFDSLKDSHSDYAVNQAEREASSWRMSGYTDVTSPWIAAMAMSDTDEPPSPLLTADNELDEEKLEEADEEVVSVFVDIIKCSQEAIREEFGETVEVHREFGREVANTYLQIDDGSVTVKPQVLESWSATETGASPMMSKTAISATRSFSPEDFAFYGPFVLGSLAATNTELTLMGSDPYAIPSGQTEIAEALIKADVDPDRLYRLSPSASLSRGEEYFEALEEEESTEEKGRTIQKPFADFESFDECVSEHSDKDDPQAYCAQIHYDATGEWPGSKSLSKSVELMANQLSSAGMASVQAWSTTTRSGVDFTIPAPFGVEGVKNTPNSSAISVKRGKINTVKLRLPTLLSSDPSASEKVESIAKECRDAVDSSFSPRFRVREGPVDPRRQMEPDSDRTGYIIHVMCEPDIPPVEYRKVTSGVQDVADTFFDELSRSSLFGKSVPRLVSALQSIGMEDVRKTTGGFDDQFSVDFRVTLPPHENVRKTDFSSSIAGQDDTVHEVVVRMPTLLLETRTELQERVFELEREIKDAVDGTLGDAYSHVRRGPGPGVTNKHIIHVGFKPIDIPLTEYRRIVTQIERAVELFYDGFLEIKDELPSIDKGEWMPYSGPDGGTGWTNGDRVSYDDEPPGEIDVSSLSPEQEERLREETDFLPSRTDVDVPESFDSREIVSEAEDAVFRMSTDSPGRRALSDEIQDAATRLEESSPNLLSYRDAFVLARNIDNEEQSENLRSIAEQREKSARQEMVDSISVGDEFDGFEVLAVGGAVRDHYLEEEPKDIDIMAVPRPEVDENPVEQLRERMEYISPESAFPVFVDSEGREVALPRTEESTGAGFQDFDADIVDPSLSVEEQVEIDMERRDQTIGALGVDARDGELYDPFGGRGDVLDRRIEPVSEAFTEDPVRLLRAARFAPRLDFDVDDQIHEWGPQMQDGVEKLPDERVLQEFEKTLQQADNPGRFLELLDEFEVLEESFPVVADDTESVVRSLDGVRSESSDETALFGAIGAGVTDADRFSEEHTLTSEQEDAVSLGSRLDDIETFDEGVLLQLAEIVDSRDSTSMDDLLSIVSGISDVDDVRDELEPVFDVAVEAVEEVDGSFVMEQENIDPSDIGSEIDGQEFGEMIQEARLEYMGSMSVEKAGTVRQEFSKEFNTRFARMMSEFVKKSTFSVVDHVDSVGERTFRFHLKGADKNQPPSSILVRYPDGTWPYKNVTMNLRLPEVPDSEKSVVKDILKSVPWSVQYQLRFRSSRVGSGSVPRLIADNQKISQFNRGVNKFGELFEAVHSSEYPSVEGQTVIDSGDVLESDTSVESEARSVPPDVWESVDSLEELSNGDYAVIGHRDGADVEGVARIIDADAEEQEVEMVVESFRSDEVRSIEVDLDFNPYEFQYRTDASSVREEDVGVPEPVTEDRPIEENVEAVFDRLSFEVMELEEQLEEEIDFSDSAELVDGASSEDVEGPLDDVDLSEERDRRFLRLSSDSAISIRSIINAVVPGDNPAGDVWAIMRGAKSSASNRDGQRADALAKEVFGASGDIYGSKTIDDYDFSEAEKKAFALYARASQIVVDELYQGELELYRGVSSYGAATFARSFFRNPDAEEFSIEETAIANYTVNEETAQSFSHRGLKLNDDDPLVLNANDILRGYYRSSAAPGESEVWLAGGDQTLSPEEIDVGKVYESFERRSVSLDEIVGQEIGSMTEQAIEVFRPHVKELVKHVDRGEVSISQGTARNVLEFIKQAESVRMELDVPYSVIEERVMAEVKADGEPTIDLTTEKAVDWIAETREMKKERVRTVHDAPDDVVVRKDSNGLFYRTPDGVPEDAEYIAPDESVPEDWESMETDYGGTYAWEPSEESQESSQESQEPSGLPDDVEPRPSISPMAFSLQAELDRVDGSFEEDLFDYLEEVANDTNNRHIEYYTDQAERRPDAVAVEDLPSESQESVSSVMSSVQPEQNACYRNAQLMATQSNELSYCEGVVVLEDMGAPVLHAWVEIDGETVDPTFEATGQDTSGEYYGTVFDDESVVRVMTEEGISRPMAMGPPRNDEQARIESGGGL